MSLEGKVALITGGAGGIGLAAALEMARQNAKIVLVDVDANAVQSAAQSVRDAGGEALAVVADVSVAAQVENYVRQTTDAFGRIDIFFNNAGIEGRLATIPDYSEEVFDRVMAINVKGAFLGLKYVLPIMLAQKSGSVIHTSSVSGLTGAAKFGAYVTSKHAIMGLMRVAAAEVGQYGVRVNAICPGPIRTRMMDEIEAMSAPDDPTSAHDTIIARNPSRRYGTPEEVARVVAFLASDAASYVNGSAWSIDGGRMAI